MGEAEEDGLDGEAEALIEALTRPKRRVRPRLAEPLREARELDVDTPAGPVRAWRLGRGPAILLVHGWDDDNCLWAPLIERLAERGLAVVALDLPGHGFSAAEDPSAAAAAGAVRAVAEAAGPVWAAVAHSFGCAVVIQAMAQGLALDRAAFIATPVPSPARRWDRARRAGVPEAVIARAAELWSARPEAAAPGFDLAAAVRALRAKALFAHSMDDEQCPVAEAEALRALWPGAAMALAEGLGHRVIAQDRRMLARIADFIDAGP